MVEGPAFYGRLSGIENLRSLVRLGGGEFSSEDARALLAKVGLLDAASRPAATYSLGMKQRLGIALALAPRPRLVILDEPTNGLDPRGIRDIRDLILRLNREEGLTFVVSSHLLNEVEQLCNRVAIIRSGKLVVECPTEDLLREGVRSLRIEASPPDVVRRAVAQVLGPERSVEEDNGAFVVNAIPGEAAALARALVAAGAEVRALIPRRPTLEDLFLDRAEGQRSAP
jgi:ABC-2 type transport system ATP-binding protein